MSPRLILWPIQYDWLLNPLQANVGVGEEPAYHVGRNVFPPPNATDDFHRIALSISLLERFHEGSFLLPFLGHLLNCFQSPTQFGI